MGGTALENSTPHFSAISSERTFIGSVVNGDARATGHTLKPSDFSDAFCREVFSACLQLEVQGKQADLITLFDMFPKIDSDALITLTQEAAGAGALAEQYAANIRNAAQRQKIIEFFLRAAQTARDASQPMEEIVSKARIYLDEVAAQSAPNGITIGTDAFVDFALWLENGERKASIPTGFPGLDVKLNGGLQGGGLYVIGARTSVGKSSFMSNIATNALRNGARVLYVSIEMPDRENIMRMVSTVSGVSLGRINNSDTLSPGDHISIAEVYSLLPGNNFWLASKARTPESIRRAALQMRAQAGLDLIVVDYIQILQPDSKTSSRVEALGQITMALKLLAMELDVPVLTAAQVNRGGVQNGSAPRLSDLRESGSIEQDADVVILLHRPDGQEKESKKRIEIALAKNRQGSTGSSNLIFDGALMRFYPLEERRNAV